MRGDGGHGRLLEAVPLPAIDQTFSDAVEAVLEDLGEQKASLAPTFAFVDPFGISGITMGQIADLLAQRSARPLAAPSNFTTTPQLGAHAP